MPRVYAKTARSPNHQCAKIINMPEREPFDYRNIDCLSQDFFCILNGVAKVVSGISYMREVTQNDCLLLL